MVNKLFFYYNYRHSFVSVSAPYQQCLKVLLGIDYQTSMQELKEHPICMIMENGAQFAGGAIIYPNNYQHNISKLCKEYDTLFILDEIATGFGRLGNMIEFIAQDSKPDIVTFGKMLTAGYLPLSVTLTNNKIYDAFLADYYDNKQLFHGHTYTGYPLACATALTNLELYDKYNLIDEVRKKSKIIENRLKEFNNRIIGDIRHKGMAVGIELINPNDKTPLRLKRAVNHVIMEEAFKRGAYLRPLANIMMLMPPLAIDNDSLNKLLDITYDVINTLEKMV
ncbi:MAG: aspartate aminotransferase family protein [Candidatus Nitrosothermus koennekii]|nr:MAG: aspartate aminotransferase family protein [Candidatus Nitrosothermus koennekii]